MTAVTSSIAVDDEVRDQGERLALIGGRKRLEIALGGLGVLRRARLRVLDAVVRDDQATNLFELAGHQRSSAEHLADLVGLRPIRALQHRDERQRALALAQIAADRLPEPVLLAT